MSISKNILDNSYIILTLMFIVKTPCTCYTNYSKKVFVIQLTTPINSQRSP